MNNITSAKTFDYFGSISLPVYCRRGSEKSWGLTMPGGCGDEWTFSNLDDLWRVARISIKEQLSHVPWAIRTVELVESNSAEGQKLLQWLHDRRGEAPVDFGRLRRESCIGGFVQPRRWMAEYQRLIKNMGGDGKTPMFGLLLGTYMLHGAVSLETLLATTFRRESPPHEHAQGLG